MLKLPTVTTKVANESLQPYFEKVYQELQALSGAQRESHVSKYCSYIEKAAQETTNKAIRIQLRINLQALLNRLGELEPPFEITVGTTGSTKQPRFGDEAYYEIPLAAMLGFRA